MIDPAGEPTHWLFIISSAIFAIGIIASLWRVIVGPSLPDRVVALDLLGFLIVAVLCVYAIVTQRPSVLSIALVAGLVLFLGTAAFAIYIERRARP